jgi:rhodanese-related sulfurtransferase
MSLDAVPALSATDLDPTSPVPPGWAVVDVREPAEWDTGHVHGSVHIPLGSLPDRLDDLPDAELLVVCRSGHRSARAVAWLVPSGFDATNLEGGLLSWAAAGLPL